MNKHPTDIVDRVTKYAHIKAGDFFTDYLENRFETEISDDEAFDFYRRSFFNAVLDVIDGNDDHLHVSWKEGNQPLAGLEAALQRKGYTKEMHSLCPLRLQIQVNGVDFTFANTVDGRILHVGNDYQFWFKKWKTVIIEFLEPLAELSQRDRLRPYYEKVILKYRMKIIANDIMQESVLGIIATRMQGEEYEIVLSSVTEDEAMVLLETPWGTMRIRSPFESFDEAFNNSLKECKQVTEHYLL